MYVAPQPRLPQPRLPSIPTLCRLFCLSVFSWLTDLPTFCKSVRIACFACCALSRLHIYASTLTIRARSHQFLSEDHCCRRQQGQQREQPYQQVIYHPCSPESPQGASLLPQQRPSSPRCSCPAGPRRRMSAASPRSTMIGDVGWGFQK